MVSITMPRQLYLLRHGQTDWNKEDRIQGGEADTRINATGVQQSHATGRYLKEFRLVDGPFDAVYCSPQTRALETANIVVPYLGMTTDCIQTDHLLVERRQGALSGLTLSSPLFLQRNKMLASMSDGDPIRDAIEKNERMAIARKELAINFETNGELQTRALQFVEKVMAIPGEKILIISHGSFLKALICGLYHLDREPSGPLTKDGNCFLSLITHTPGEGYRLVLSPTTLHLKKRPTA